MSLKGTREAQLQNHPQGLGLQHRGNLGARARAQGCFKERQFTCPQAVGWPPVYLIPGANLKS